MKRLLAVALVVLTFVTPLARDESPTQSVIANIKAEGQQHSSAADTLSWLSDVYGPRLTGSPNLRHAAEWARDRLRSWGIERAALEPVDGVGRGWVVDRFSIEVTAPQYIRLVGYPRAWSPPTTGPISGAPVLVNVQDPGDFDKYRGKLRGQIVLNGRPAPEDIGFAPEATRLSSSDLARRRDETNPNAQGYENPVKSYADDIQAFRRILNHMTAVWKFFAQEGVAAVITPSAMSEVVEVDGFFDRNWQSPFPAFVIAAEEYGRIVRLLDRKVPVTLSLALASRFIDNAEDFNVVAEIPGSDPRVKDEVVMIGAHLDSWHGGTGATDNATGCAAVLEAMRILKAVGAKPRRTVRVALWTGEEQDYLGSLSYVKAHFGDPATLALKPEQSKVSVYLNLDTGAGRIRGIDLQGNKLARPMFEEWLSPFKDLGAATVSIINTGGTDHMPFDGVGIPAFTFVQDPLNYDTRTHHSSLDVYEEAPQDDLKQMSIVVAGVAYEAANNGTMVPRKALKN